MSDDNIYPSHSNNGEIHFRSNAIDKILRSRPPQERASANEEFQCYTVGDGRPQVAFCVHRKDGTLDGFMYHNIDNIAFFTQRGTDYLSFNHRGKAVTLAGHHLKPLFHNLMGLSIIEIHEHFGDGINEEEPCVMRVEVTMLR